MLNKRYNLNHSNLSIIMRAIHSFKYWSCSLLIIKFPISIMRAIHSFKYWWSKCFRKWKKSSLVDLQRFGNVQNGSWITLTTSNVICFQLYSPKNPIIKPITQNARKWNLTQALQIKPNTALIRPQLSKTMSQMSFEFSRLRKWKRRRRRKKRTYGQKR